MTILNAHVAPTAALVAVDTATQHSTLGRIEGSKMLLLPHVNVVLAGRGLTFFLQAVFSYCFHRAGDFDSIEANIVEYLTGSFDYTVQNASSLGLTDQQHIDRQQLLVVGWSQRRARMYGMSYIKETAERAVEANPLEPFFLAPWDVDLLGPMNFDPSCAEGMEAIARAQVGYYGQRHPETGFGGRLLIAELTRDTCTITSRCSLD